MQTVDIPIRDEFENAEGRFRNYDAYDGNQREQLLKQKHVDIRSFYNDSTDSVRATVPMLSLNLIGMTTLDTKTMSNLEGLITTRRGEQWTQGAVNKQSDRNYHHGLSLTCTTGTNTTSSVIIALV